MIHTSGFYLRHMMRQLLRPLKKFAAAQIRPGQRILACGLLATLIYAPACWKTNENGNSASPTNSSAKTSRRVTNEKFLASLPPGSISRTTPTR